MNEMLQIFSFLIEFKTEAAYFIAIHLVLQILRSRYRVSQKTWEFSDEFDIVFSNNSSI